MWLLLFCSVLGGAVFLERSLFYLRVTLHLGDFMRGLSNLIRHQRWSEAQVECASFSTPVTRVLHAAVLRHGAPREELRAIVQEAGQLEVLRLEQNLGLISGIGLVAPLIGLLGTVTGMIEVFSKISSQSGLTSSTDLAAGIYQSLLTTAGGRVVAIPCSIGECTHARYGAGGDRGCEPDHGQSGGVTNHRVRLGINVLRAPKVFKAFNGGVGVNSRENGHGRPLDWVYSKIKRFAATD
jgi:biopolymer transport protein ExbB